MYYYHMTDHNDWFIDLIITILGILFITLAVMLMIKLSKDNKPNIRNKNTPLDIIKERYAKGEITKEEFDKVKKDLIE